MSYNATVHAKAIDLTRLAVEMTTEAGSGHPSSAASLAHLVTVLLYDHMRHDLERPEHPAADRLVLSEGHACPILYAAGADLGIAMRSEDGGRRRMTEADAMRLREIDSPVDGHPNPAEGFPFFPAATGSLGQGLSIAAGIALAARLDGLAKRVFCLIGDGESREGQVWEALDFLVEQRLRAVLPIFNCNAFGQTGEVSRQQRAEALAAKLEAFGLETEVIDGHDATEILRCLKRHEGEQVTQERPLAVVAKTVKGWGMPTLQGDGHHGKPVKGEDAAKALRELDRTARELEAAWTAGELKIPALEVPSEAAVQRPAATPGASVPSLPEALKQLDRKQIKATRKAFGLALRMLGHARPELIALDGDVGNSTYTEELEHDTDLRDRFVQCHIAEQNMVSVAAGLCSEGKMPFLATFGKFLNRAYDQLEMALVSGFPLKVVGSHVGVSLAADGPSQMALPDVGFFRALSTVTARNGSGPLIYVLTPCDAFSAYALTLQMAAHDGACYLRTMRPDVPHLYDENTPFELGGHQVVATGGDLLIAAWGYMVHEALRAREQLAGKGIDAAVVDLYSLPFDGTALAQLARESNAKVLTLEDNYGGGLGSALTEALAAEDSPFHVRQMFVRRIPKSGRTPDAVLEHLGLSRDHIVKTATDLVKQKGRTL